MLTIKPTPFSSFSKSLTNFLGETSSKISQYQPPAFILKAIDVILHISSYFKALGALSLGFLLFSCSALVLFGYLHVISGLIAGLCMIIMFEIVAVFNPLSDKKKLPEGWGVNVQTQLNDWKHRKEKNEEDVKKYYSEKFRDIHEKHQEEMSRFSQRSTQSRSGCDNVLDSLIMSDSESIKEVVKGY